MSMRRGKLHLKLDDLRVDSFAIQGEADARGTVRGHVSWLCPETDYPSATDCTNCQTIQPCPTGATYCYVCPTNQRTRDPGCGVV